MLRLENKYCCGCTACVSVCPQKCLQMVENNQGFLEPKLIDYETCINCDRCNQVCPVLNNKEEQKAKQRGFIIQNKDDGVRKQSASGGAFSAIADCVLNEQGVVYGAAYGENFVVKHIGVNNQEDLFKLRNSKYVQSDLQGIFNEVKSLLKNNVKVCFSGTPCQIEGLKTFLGKEYDNLLLVDVVCHGVGSPLVWRKYLEKFDNVPEHIYFRWKHYGYKYSTMSFFKEGKEIYSSGVETDQMLQAYFSNNCDRETCYNCPFKKRYRVSDITIWDWFEPKYFDKTFDDDKGTTALLVHSKKGEAFFTNLMHSGKINYLEVNPDDLVFGNNEMINSVNCGSVREKFLNDANTLNGKELFDKYFPINAKCKLKKLARIVLLKTKLYKTVKYKLFIRRRRKYKSKDQKDN